MLPFVFFERVSDLNLVESLVLVGVRAGLLLLLIGALFKRLFQ